MISKKIALSLAVIMIIMSLSPAALLAQTQSFRDVPTGHFAFEAINWVSSPENGAFMVGDASGNFHPNRNLNKFEAVQIFAMAAGFRHVTDGLPAAEREVFTRSMNAWRPFLDTMAEEYSTWNRTADREIAFLLYRGILTSEEVQNFILREGATETRPLLTRQQAVAWMVRLVGQGEQAQAVTLPAAAPFRDDALISPGFRRYVYHARQLGIMHGSGGYMHPLNHFTRAEMSTVFHNALSAPAQTQAAGVPTTLSGIITNLFLDTHVSINSATGTETFAFAPNAMIIIDNTQRTAAFLREGMTATVLVDQGRQIVSLNARSVPGERDEPAEQSSPAATVSPTPAQTVYSDEGVVASVISTPAQMVTIRKQRVRISGQIIDEERTFSFAPNATITRGGEPSNFDDIQVGDIAFFGFSDSAITTLELMERERTLTGMINDVRPPDNMGLPPIFIIEEADGRSYELRSQPATEFTRGYAEGLNWYDLRIGDKIIAEVEFDRIVSIRAFGERRTVYGRLNEMRITERNTELTFTLDDGEVSSFFVRPGVFDVYALRLGMNLSVSLDSREVITISHQDGQAQATTIVGFIQSIRPDGTMTVVEGHGATARTHSITVPANTTITSGGSNISFHTLRVNMNIYIVLTAPASNVTRSITVLP